MTPQQVIDFYKNQEAIAEAAMCSQAAISKWFRKGYVPLRSQRLLEHRSGGMLTADTEAEFAQALININGEGKNGIPRAR